MTLMERDCGSPSVCMPELFMTSLLTSFKESNRLKD